jgi:hypothetical protein
MKMKEKNWIKENKNLLILLGLIGLVFIVVLGYDFYDRIPDVNQDCLEYMHSNYFNYIPGEIVIVWNINITEEEANSILNSYGLQISEFSYLTTIVSVQEGTELEWVCVFKKYEYPNVEDVFVNYRVLPTGEK